MNKKEGAAFILMQAVSSSLGKAAEILAPSVTTLVVEGGRRILGVASTEEATQMAVDEGLFYLVLAQGKWEDPKNHQRVREFTRELRERDLEKFRAMKLFIAKMVASLEKREKSDSRDSSEGITAAVSFLEDMLAQEDFESRLKFLEDNDVFHFIQKKEEKAPLKEHILPKMKEAAEEIGQKAEDLAENLADRIEKSGLSETIEENTPPPGIEIPGWVGWILFPIQTRKERKEDKDD